MTYLAVVNWRKYQHYKNRRPPWVKFYVTFSEDTQDLSPRARLLAALLICVAANKDNRIPDDARWIGTEVSMRQTDVRKAVEELIADHFIERVVASNGASNGASKNASPIRDRERRGEKPKNQPPPPTASRGAAEAPADENGTVVVLPTLKEMP